VIFDAAKGKKTWDKEAKAWRYEDLAYPWIDAVEKWRKSGCISHMLSVFSHDTQFP
jgi:hypothetical protein